MNDRLDILREKCLHRDFKEYRQDIELECADDFHERGLSVPRRSAERFAMLMNAEKAVVLPDERITITRTIKKVPSIYTQEEYEENCKKYHAFDECIMRNINPDYEETIRRGLDDRKAQILELLDGAKARQDGEAEELYECILTGIDATMAFAEKYRKEALRVGNREVAEMFEVIPAKGAQTFQQALQFLRLLNFTLWYNIKYLITFGRIDQYLYPYYKADVEAGRITYEEAYELVREFFLILNRDTDLYFGFQMGDNGLSMVLGGTALDGSSQYNELSAMCLDACRENNLIDPKLNLRVNKHTPMSVYTKAAELTKVGLGFPQYCNDDVIIDTLIRAGYDPDDAYNYAVAACWEYTIPGLGMDITDLDAINFPQIVVDVVNQDLNACGSFDDVKACFEKRFRAEADRIVNENYFRYLEPCPWQTFLTTGSVEKGRDFSKCAKYNNYGIFNAGLSTAADSLAVIKKLIFEEGSVTKEELKQALAADFEGFSGLRNKAINDVPKMGNNDDYADDIGVWLVDLFHDALKDKKNYRGGRFRAGTGTANFYMDCSRDLGATPDGRKAGKPLPADFSPSLVCTLNGPLSVISSFTKPRLVDMDCGGPLTLELHDTVFRNSDGINKTAALIRSYIEHGGNQLQLNTVNRERMIDAKAHPENYPNLIVRVWGWSGYFVELDEEYQDQIISRTEFGL